MRRGLVMAMRMRLTISAAADVSADKTYPQVGGRLARGTRRMARSCGICKGNRMRYCAWVGGQEGLRVPADGTPIRTLRHSEIPTVGNPYRLSPHLLRHMQWKVCEQGTVISPVTAESMRSRQTGQVGSSYMLFGDASRDRLCEKASSMSMTTERTCTTWQISG